MTKGDMIKEISKSVKKLGVTQDQIKEVLDTYDNILLQIIEDEDSYTTKVYTIQGIAKQARLGTDPNNGKTIVWPSKIVAKCKWNKAVRDINKKETE